MSEFTWYARLAVWAGAVVMLAQSVTGHGLGFMTVLGVLLLSGGFLAFLGGLAFDGRAFSWAMAGAASAPPVVETAPASEEAPMPPEASVAIGDIPASEPELVVRDSVFDAASVARSEPPASAPAGRVDTVELAEASPEVGATCPRCGNGLQPGQIAATCYICGAVHHAGCWIENHFHCSAPGCLGHGSLEEPRRPGSQG